MAEDVDIDSLLDGLEGQARAERSELIQWLRGKGFTADQIHGEVSPMLLPAGRIVGNDGVHKAIDCVGGQLGADVSRALAPGAEMIVYGALSTHPETDPDRLTIPEAGTCVVIVKGSGTPGFDASGCAASKTTETAPEPAAELTEAEV